MTTDKPVQGDIDPNDSDERLAADIARLAELRVEQEKQELLKTWLDTGGTEEEFEKAWPAIHAQLGKARVDELGDKARGRSLTRFRKQP